MRRSRPPRPRSRRRWLALAAAICVLLSACGSNLDPSDVRAADSTAPMLGSDAPSSVADPGVVSDPSVGSDPVTDASAAGPDDAPAVDPGPPTASEGEVPPLVAGEIPPANEATGERQAGSCDGFANQVGITDDTITLANAADISGPVPGLFQAAQDGAAAFVAYFNATDELCGRKLGLLELDSRADAGGDQQAYARACSESFAAVGSVSSQDAGGAGAAAQCGLPDVRAFVVTPQRSSCRTCFAAYTVSPDQIAATHPQYWVRTQKSASQHVAIFYVNVDAARINAESAAAGFEKGGMNVDLLRPIDTSEFNYAPYVQEMKDKDIDFVEYFGPYQFAIKLQQAMQQQNFTPSVYLEDPTIYDANYEEQAGSLANGVYVYSPIQLFDNSKIPEMVLYRQWLDQVAPGAVPNYYGLFAWSAARLFVEEAVQLGGRLSRETLVGALRRVKGWTGNGIHAPMQVGDKTTSGCIKIIRHHNGRWSQVSPGDFMCGGLINTGVGG